MTGPLRWLRGSLVGMCAVLLGTIGHACAGGQVGLTALLVSSVVAIGTGVALSGRQWTASALAVFLVAAQLVLHVALASSTAMPAVGHHGMVMHPMPMPLAGTAAGDLVMLLAHLIAASATAAALRYGEAWCWALISLLLAGRLALQLPAVPSVRRPRTHPTTARVAAAALLRGVLVRRGPPVAAAP